MQTFRGAFISLGLAALLFTSASSPHGALAVADHLSVGPALILWRQGTDQGLVETITPAVVENRRTWRITHYSQDPTATNINEYDMYELDRATLAPIRSVMNTDGLHLDLTFGEKEVTVHKTTTDGDSVERVPLATAVQPEGPGLDVFVATLPLAVSYRKSYFIVDRWDGHGSGRIKTVSLSVAGRAVEETSLGKQEVYDILIKSGDGSFQIAEKVLAKGLHFPVSVKYTRGGKTYPVSEVVAIAQ